jgi:DNA-binding protein H-NS
MSQQLELLQQQLREVSKEVELHNQQRLQAEEKVAALQLQGDTTSAASSDDSILLQSLRDELAAQCADVAEARRLKYHVRYHLLSV